MLAGLHCCFTSQREVISKKLDSKPVAVLQIKAIMLIGLIRSPLQPREYKLFHLCPLPLRKCCQWKCCQWNPPNKGYHKPFHLKRFGQ